MGSLNGILRIRGSVPAVPTPFAGDNLDLSAFDRLLTHVIAGGSSAVVIAGSTGEGSSLEVDEYAALVERAANCVNQIPIIAGIGAVSTRKAVHLAYTAKTAGARGLLLVTPYYIRATHEGVRRHVAAVADATGLPIILYNVPSRTGYDVPCELVLQLHRDGHIVGLKECAENLDRIETLGEETGGNLSIYCGDDEAALEMRRRGAVGCISVVANLLPDRCTAAHWCWDVGEVDEATTHFAALEPLIQALTLEPNPQGIKYALSVLGLCRPDLRLPLLPVSTVTAREIEKAVKEAPRLSENYMQTIRR